MQDCQYEPSTQSLHEKLFIVPVLTGRPKISTFGTFTEKHFLATFSICAKINVQDCLKFLVLRNCATQLTSE